MHVRVLYVCHNVGGVEHQHGGGGGGRAADQQVTCLQSLGIIILLNYAEVFLIIKIDYQMFNIDT